MNQKVIKTGNSLAVVIPSQFVNSVGIESGQDVQVEASPEKGQVTYFFKGARQLSIAAKLGVPVK